MSTATEDEKRAEDKKAIEELCMNLEFLRCTSLSKEAKVADFWKYLDEQGDILPHVAEKLEENKFDDLSSMRSSTCESSVPSSSKLTPTALKSKVQPKKEMKKKTEVTSSSPYEKIMKEDLRFADNLDMTYDEINADIAYFQKQLIKCHCKEKCDCKKEVELSDDEC